MHEPGSVRALLHDASGLVWRLNGLLEAMVPWRSGQRDEVARQTNKTASTPPWQSQAANLVMDLHAEARRMERLLVVTVVGTQGSEPRGGSSENTKNALDALTVLTEITDDTDVWDILRSLERWIMRAEVVLGYREPVRRLPRQPGEGEPRCPWCQYLTLRCLPASGRVSCVNPECRDDEGRKPRAVLSVSLSGVSVLTWQDGWWQDSRGHLGEIEGEEG